MRIKIKLAVLNLGTVLFQTWLLDTHPVGHPVEAVKYHAFRAINKLGRSL
ncbi:hypothetical protein [Caulobacter phage Cd1]|uniref:Uncharacterized protein n=1 Tax=Caulobacter phage Cd1 TaxID=718008 RepID=F1ADN5_9CAUD|nr:hypothetical protein [Caulobacter phage Cd1]